MKERILSLQRTESLTLPQMPTKKMKSMENLGEGQEVEATRREAIREKAAADTREAEASAEIKIADEIVTEGEALVMIAEIEDLDIIDTDMIRRGNHQLIMVNIIIGGAIRVIVTALKVDLAHLPLPPHQSALERISKTSVDIRTEILASKSI